MKQQILKKYSYQTESNKFYTILEDSEYDIDNGIELNPYSESENIFDTLVVVATSNYLEEKANFNIRNTKFGYFLEVYSSISSDVSIVDGKLSLDEILKIISKVRDFSFSETIKYLQVKYGLKKEYFFKSVNSA